MSAKITADMLVFIISAFCGVKDNKISPETKEICIEKFVNCAIIEDGYSTNIIVDKCKNDWIEYAKERNLK